MDLLGLSSPRYMMLLQYQSLPVQSSLVTLRSDHSSSIYMGLTLFPSLC